LFVALGVVAFVFSTRATDSAALPAPHGLALFTAIIIALQSVLYTYDGWYGVIYFGEEVRNPKRDVTASMFGGVGAIVAIYLVVNLALVRVLPMSQLAHENLAVGAAAAVVFGKYGDSAIRILAILSLLSTINAYTLTGPRILYAMSCDELFHHHAKRVNKGGTPSVTLAISTVAAVMFILMSFDAVLNALAFFFVANYSMAYASLIIMRRREPNRPRPYRAWGYPWTTGIVLLGSISFLGGAVASDVIGHGKDSLRALVLLAVSYPLYLIVKVFTARKTAT